MIFYGSFHIKLFLIDITWLSFKIYILRLFSRKATLNHINFIISTIKQSTLILRCTNKIRSFLYCQFHYFSSRISLPTSFHMHLFFIVIYSIANLLSAIVLSISSLCNMFCREYFRFLMPAPFRKKKINVRKIRYNVHRYR